MTENAHVERPSDGGQPKLMDKREKRWDWRRGVTCSVVWLAGYPPVIVSKEVEYSKESES